MLTPGEEHCSRSMTKVFGRESLRFTSDLVFDEVVTACAAPRDGARGTWITPQMRTAYQRLHRQCHALSLECWQGGELVGGLYGVQAGGFFCGESMFSRRANASKAAFVVLSRTLARGSFDLIDCQIPNPHLQSLGVRPLPREQFLRHLVASRDKKVAWPHSDDFATTAAMLGSKP